MSLTKLLKVPVKLFKKDVISFLIIRRFDLGILEDSLRYIGVKPSASISKLRYKVWHLLDLPDYCDEIIVLKLDHNNVIPLTELRRGNDPRRPFYLEVYLPGARVQSSTGLHNKLLTIQNGEDQTQLDKSNLINAQESVRDCPSNSYSQSTMSNETVALSKFPKQTERAPLSNVLTDLKRPDLTSRISSTSFFKLNPRKSRDNFSLTLMKIQNDLCTLNNKLTILENRILT